MTETEFRVNHSTVIEYYQYIEMRLKGICTAIYSNSMTDWFQRLNDYDGDPLGKLIQKIHVAQEEKIRIVFSAEEFNDLDRIRQARNFWCHQCFGGDFHIIFKNGVVKQPEYAKKLVSDLREAIEWDERLANKHHELSSVWK